MNEMRYVVLLLAGLVPWADAFTQVPDSLPPRDYFPLSVGNAWHYQHAIGRPHTIYRPQDESELRLERYRIVDAVVRGDSMQFVLVFDERTERGELIRQDTTLIWYDEASGSVAGEDVPQLIAWLRCLDAPVGRAESTGEECWSFVGQDELYLPELFEDVVQAKSFSSYVWSISLVHGIGIVDAGGGCEPCDAFSDTDHWTLRYASVGGREYGVKAVRAERRPSPGPRTLSVYPQPIRGQAFIDVPGRGVFAVFDVLGRQVYAVSAEGAGTLTIDLAALRPGLYLVRFEGQASAVVIQ